MPPAAVVSERRADLDHDPLGRGDLGTHQSLVLGSSSVDLAGLVLGVRRLVEAAGHVGALLALAALGHRLVDRRDGAGRRAGTRRSAGPRRGGRASARRRRCRAGSRRPRRCPGRRSAPGRPRPRRARPASASTPSRLSRSARKPDGLVVAEVGLPDPALGLLAAHAPALARSRLDGELRCRRDRRAGRITIRVGSVAGVARPGGRRRSRPSRRSARAGPRGWTR